MTPEQAKVIREQLQYVSPMLDAHIEAFDKLIAEHAAMKDALRWRHGPSLGGRNRNVIASNGNWVDQCWYDEQMAAVARDGEWVPVEDIWFMEMPKAPVPP